MADRPAFRKFGESLRVRRLATGLCLVLALAALPAWRTGAEEIPEINVAGEEILAEGADLRYGLMEFHPYLATDWSYVDNLFFSKHNRVADNLFTFTPGVHINWPFAGNHVFKTDWQSQIRRYMDHTEVDNAQHFSDTLLKLDYTRYFFEFRNKYAFIEEVGDIQFTDRLVRWADDASILSGVRFDQLDLSFGYAKKLRRWPRKRDQFLDSSEDVGNVTLDIRAKPNLTFFTRYELHALDYDGDLRPSQTRLNDQRQINVLAGARGSLAPSIGWSLGAGVAHLRLSKRNRALRFLQGRTVSNHLLVRASLKWDAIPERTLVRFNLERGVSPSTTSDYAENLSVSLFLRQRWSERLKTKLTLSHSFFNRAKGTDFKSYHADISTQYRITRWASVFGRYQFDQRDALGDIGGQGDDVINTVRIGVVLAW